MTYVLKQKQKLAEYYALDMAVKALSQWFWNEYFWLPGNVTWKDLEPSENEPYPNINHLYVPLGLCIVMIVVRKTLEKLVFIPLSLKFGLKRRRPLGPAPNPMLETLAKRNGFIEGKDAVGLAKQYDLNERQVERWLRDYRRRTRPSILEKVAETAWRFVFYTAAFSFGLWNLWNTPWLWDLEEAWKGYPRHYVSDGIWWYYMFELTFYWSLMLSQFSDVKRKDFWQMFVHHLATVMLLSFSWATNLTRSGSVVLVIHDCADIFLEFTKMLKYFKKQAACDIFFGVFTIVWILTRIVIFPVHVIYSGIFEAPKLYPVFPGYFLFNGLLLLLLSLHIFWTIAIVRMVVVTVQAGGMQKDIRSSSEESEEETSSGRSGNTTPIPTPNLDKIEGLQ
ncbi:unnamed protein product [Cyprideis torosa]|uniref:Uncharacterized protein n=1 Tax=Cyprideis torosa TaxID=163714 RepID=A0A7R8W9K5_9CRUS|nr:unnamed protein product [Cyprideis torosa]CAG0889939.1 unnamed protein product [Cyprideis torosa]